MNLFTSQVVRIDGDVFRAFDLRIEFGKTQASFLGLGNPDDRQPEWGQMLGRAQQYIYDYPHLAIYPAVCIIVVALGFTLMGESLREALDPKSRR